MLVYWEIDDIAHLVGFPSYLGCVYVLYFELTIDGPMPFSNWNSYFIFENKEKKGKKRQKNHVK